MGERGTTNGREWREWDFFQGLGLEAPLPDKSFTTYTVLDDGRLKAPAPEVHRGML